MIDLSAHNRLCCALDNAGTGSPFDCPLSYSAENQFDARPARCGRAVINNGASIKPKTSGG
ncbi:hypothetical protein [Terrabacter sp. RAF57]|uniref:hypothetical protein n=1 Tax=Terrabacter sp. RAF57 TaxID=3233063 RepID=UPI003F9EA313